MAQSGFTPIQLYRSATPGAAPTAGNLAAGELALNTADEKLYFKNSAGSVVSIATGAGTVSSVAASGGTTGLTFSGSPITSSGTLTLSGTLGVANGGTGTTAAPTNGQLLIGNGTGFSLGTLTQGSGISITNSAGGITIATSGGGGTVTSVSGTGSVNGITLTGTVTSSGSLTLGGALSNVSLASQVTGTLPVANGGTGTATAFTAGAIVFAGASGVYSQNASNLFWDNTNARLGIGSSVPVAKVFVYAASGLLNAFRAQSGTNASITIQAENTTGTLSLSCNDSFSSISTSQNGYLSFGTNNTERARFDSSGNLGLGTTSPSTLLDVNNDKIRVRTAKTPSSATDTGNAGDICWDSNYIYVCVATNTWKRVAIATWP